MGNGHKISEIIKISFGYSTEVDIERDFLDSGVNDEKLRAYIPLKSHREAFYSMSRGLHPTEDKRVFLITGAYGTGKSHLGLILANYFTLPSWNEKLEPVFEKIKGKDPMPGKFIVDRRNTERPYLVVLCTGGIYESFGRTLIANLHEAIKRDKLADFIPSTAYSEINEKIDVWEKEYPSVFKNFQSILEGKGQTLGIFKDRILKQFDEEAYRIFCEIHPRVTGGTDFIPYYSKEPAEVFQDLIKKLRKEAGYQGIVVIFDEFGKHLEQISSNPNSDESLRIQNFAQYCKRSGEEQCFLIVVAHGSLRDYAMGKMSDEEWKKVSGRFEELNLTGIDEGIEELLDTIIIQPSETKFNELWDKATSSPELEELYTIISKLELYPEKDRHWIFEKVIEGGYPLHPLAVFSLIRLSEAIGQYHRTMFTFLDDEDTGLKGFINKHTIFSDDGGLNFFQVDYLFDYFEKAIQEQGKKERKYRLIHEGFIEAKTKLPKESVLGIRLLKAIAILSILKRVGIENLPTTIEILQYALNLPESKRDSLGKLLEEMKNIQALKKREATGEWLFKKGYEDYDLEEDLNNKLEISFDNPFRQINEKYPPRNIEAKVYNEKHFMDRRLVAKFVSPDHLSNIEGYKKEIETQFLDGMILYVTSETEEEIEAAKRIAEREKHRQLLIAVPKEPVEFMSLFKKIEALGRLKDDPPYSIPASEAREDLDTFFKDTEDTLKKKLEWVQSAKNLYWYTYWGVNSTLERGEEIELVNEIMEKVFDKTPRIAHEIAFNWRGREFKKASRIEAMDKILETEVIEIKERGSIPAPDNIIKQALKENSLLQFKEPRGEGFNAYGLSSPPDETPVSEVLKAIERNMIKKDAPISMLPVINRLRQSPFGLSLMSIEVFLSCFMREYKDQLAVIRNFERLKKGLSGWEIVPITGEHISQIVHKPEDYHSFFYELTSVQKGYLEHLKNLFGFDKPLPKGNIVEGVKDIVLEWVGELPTLTKKAEKFRNNRCRDLLDIIFTEQEARRLLLTEIPKKCGIDKDSQEWKEDNAIETLDILKHFVEEINSFAENFAENLIKELRSVFEVKGDTEEDFSNGVNSWYSKLPEYTKGHPFVSDAAALKKAASTEGKIRERFLEELPKDLGLKSYLDWDQDKTDKFILKVAKARREIEIYKPTTVEPPPLPPSEEEIREFEQFKASFRKQISALLEDKKINKKQLEEFIWELYEEFCE